MAEAMAHVHELSAAGATTPLQPTQDVHKLAVEEVRSNFNVA